MKGCHFIKVPARKKQHPDKAQSVTNSLQDRLQSRASPKGAVIWRGHTTRRFPTSAQLDHNSGRKASTQHNTLPVCCEMPWELAVPNPSACSCRTCKGRSRPEAAAAVQSRRDHPPPGGTAKPNQHCPALPARCRRPHPAVVAAEQQHPAAAAQSPPGLAARRLPTLSRTRTPWLRTGLWRRVAPLQRGCVLCAWT